MIGAIKKLLSLKTDQECLIKQMEQWRKELPEDHIYIYIFQQKGRQLQKILANVTILFMNPEDGLFTDKCGQL